jgi:hypothetical protein
VGGKTLAVGSVVSLLRGTGTDGAAGSDVMAMAARKTIPSDLIRLVRDWTLSPSHPRDEREYT